MALRSCFMVGIALVTACSGGTDQNPFGVTNSGDEGEDTGTNFTSSISAASTLDGGTTGGSAGGTSDGDEFDDEDGTTVSLDAADDDLGEDTTTGSAGDSTTGSESTDSGGSSSDDGGSSSDDGGSSTGVAIMCPQEVTCVQAADIGSVSGDTSSSNLMFTGTEPTWIEFEVREDDSDIFPGETLQFEATLTSPACCDFDIYVYRGIEGGNTGCGGFFESSTSVGAVDSVDMEWGEGIVPNGLDDTVIVAIEIVPKNDECDGDQEWTLVIAGD
ncbi:MAG: hypothetical protein JKY37_26620 [Nannocystaceae bacterium]|nr:hypothetical protein [Nannocystaceae bacterium]